MRLGLPPSIKQVLSAVLTVLLVGNGPAGAKTVMGLGKAAANRGADAIAVSHRFTEVAFTGPGEGDVGSPSAHFAVSVSGVISGTIHFTPNDGGDGGTFIPASISITASGPTRYFVYLPLSAGTKTISLKNDASLDTPALPFEAIARDVPLPSWVPAEGEVAVLNQTNGLITNTFLSTNAPYYEAFYHSQIDAFSTTVVNPYFGTYGALLLFGGGHSANNDNSVTALELGQTSCTWKRLTDPSPIFGGPGTVTNDIKSLNSQGATQFTSHRDDTYGEFTIDHQPCSEHSYSTLDVIGPTEGGGAYGTLIKVIGPSLGMSGALYALSCHQLIFNSIDGPFGWERRTNVVPEKKFFDSMFYSVYVPSQKRVYFDAHLGRSAQWYDLQTDTYVYGTGAGFDRTGQTANSGIMFFVPERGLVIFADGTSASGSYTLRLQYMDVTVDQPNWVTSVTLAAPIAVCNYFSTAAWCPDNHRIIVGAVAGDNSGVYEIAIPSPLSAPWPVTRVPFGPGQTIDFPVTDDLTRWSYKRWTYNPKTKSIVYLPRTGDGSPGGGGDDTVFVYRPRGAR